LNRYCEKITKRFQFIKKTKLKTSLGELRIKKTWKLKKVRKIRDVCKSMGIKCFHCRTMILLKK
jgi:hypothetical protein